MTVAPASLCEEGDRPAAGKRRHGSDAHPLLLFRLNVFAGEPAAGELPAAFVYVSTLCTSEPGEPGKTLASTLPAGISE